MARNFRPHAILLVLSIAAIMPGSALAEATAALKAVAKNGLPIVPTNELAVLPGDEIEVEIYLSGWGHPPFDGRANTGLIRIYELWLDGYNSVQSGDHGLILPKGWDAPLVKDPPPCTDPKYPIPDPKNGCVGPNFHREQLAYISSDRADFVLSGFPNTSAVATGDLNFVWGGTILEPNGQPDGQCVGGPEDGLPCQVNADCYLGTCGPGLFYGGTLNLVVGDGACGRFTFSFQHYGGFMGNPLPFEIAYGFRRFESLVLDAPACDDRGACCYVIGGECFENVRPEECGFEHYFYGLGTSCPDEPCGPPNFIVSSDPPHCAIDARIPFIGSPTNRQGFRSIQLEFWDSCGNAEDSPEDYTVQQFPESVPTVIESVMIGGNTATITFFSPIQPRRWTCVKHNASGTRACLGYLPADANGDRTAAPVDLLTIIDNLNGLIHPPLPIWACDIDRSNQCVPADILTEIDILNLYYPFYCDPGPCNVLPVCPSTFGP